ncbi:Uncharacterised protein [Staphylococcus agnetis]|nr:hypothetical protein [Staphylococcus agnetis]SUK14681.1 Uncharacterised protein [Staphylococcus agnetis]
MNRTQKSLDEKERRIRLMKDKIEIAKNLKVILTSLITLIKMLVGN